MLGFRRHLLGSLPLIAAATALACGGESLVVPPTTGTLQVTTSTSGTEPDADGYIITVDGTDHGAVPATGTASVESVSEGDHVVGLSGVAGNCQVQGDNPRTVAITAGATATAAFAVACTAPPANPGSIRITTATTGSNPDADGYAFAIDGGTGQPIGANVSTTVDNIAAGDHTVGLSGVAGNCTVADVNPRPVTVAAGATVAVNFSITCTASTGSIQVTTVTTGSNPDNGYSVSVDGGTAQNIVANGTFTFDLVAAGTRSVRLSGVAANCTVAGVNPQQVAVSVGQTATAAFSITCAASAQARITFVRNDGAVHDLFTVNPDGSGLSRLTGFAGLAETPQWSPDRSKIVFEGGQSGEIFVINADGSGQTNLTMTRSGTEKETGPKWSPDGSRILFTKTTIIPSDLGDTEVTDLYTMNADGSNPTRLTTTGTEAAAGGYDWSPNGLLIAFESEPVGTLQGVYVVSSSGGIPTRLSGGGVASWAPNWSPDGRKIAFLSQAGAQVQVWTMNADGSVQTQLTDQTGDDKAAPSWSPDGSKIVYMYAPAFGTSDIWTVNANTRETFNVTKSGGDNTSPVWSPDGGRIAFVFGFGSGSPVIRVINADGTGLVPNVSSGYRPDW